MLIIYFLLGLGMTIAHSDYGVSFRAQNFDNTVRNTDKDTIIKHQREKRFVAGYLVPQNVTNKPTWGSMNITRNMTFTRPSNNSRNFEQNFINNRSQPGSHGTVIYPGQPGYVEPLKNTSGLTHSRLGPNGNMTDVTGKYFNPWQNNNVNATWPVNPNYIIVRPGYNSNGNNTFNATGYIVPVNPATPEHTRYPGYPGYPAPNAVYPAPNTSNLAPNTAYPIPNTGYPAQNTGYPATNINPGQNYNTSATRPVYPNYNNIIVIPANKNNFSNNNPSGYNIQPVNPVTPGNRPYYPVPNAGYPAPNTGYPAPNTWYPASNTGYTAPNTWYPASNSVYPASNTAYPAPNTGYPVPNTGYPPPNTGYPAPNTGYPVPNTGYTPPNTAYPASSGNFNTNGNGFNNTASLANCKCKLPRTNSTITKEERTMDACMIACNNCPEGMKMSSLGICVKDLDYDDE